MKQRPYGGQREFLEGTELKKEGNVNSHQQGNCRDRNGQSLRANQKYPE